LTLKHRVKKIEKAIVPSRERGKLWMVSEDFQPGKDNNSAANQKRIKEIKAGKIEHKNGGFWQRGDSIFIIARCFIPELPDDKLKGKAKEERIKALKKERQVLIETSKGEY